MTRRESMIGNKNGLGNKSWTGHIEVGNWKGPNAGYFAAHWRLKVRRGRAKDLICVDCGRQAAEWSYDGGAPDEKIAPRRGKGWQVDAPFSLDLEFYSPRCRSCHRRLDHATA